jgi:hypothetical protein
LRVKEGSEWKTRDVILPGIYEYRITAHRTGEYRGHDEPEYGPLTKYAGVEAPEWCKFVVYRGTRGSLRETWARFPVRLLFSEAVTRKQDGGANERWKEAPTQMLTKCAEAAALREAFPEELGGEMTADEMIGRAMDIDTGQPIPPRHEPAIPKPAGYDDWRIDLEATADEGREAFNIAWKDARRDCRDYLVQTEPDALDLLQQKADAVAGTVEADAPARDSAK